MSMSPRIPEIKPMHIALKGKQVFNVFSLTNMQILFFTAQCWGIAECGAIFYVVKWRIHANKYPIPNKWLCCNPSFEFASDHHSRVSVRTQLGAAFVAPPRFAILSIRSSAMSFFLCSLVLLLFYTGFLWNGFPFGGARSKEKRRRQAIRNGGEGAMLRQLTNRRLNWFDQLTSDKARWWMKTTQLPIERHILYV